MVIQRTIALTLWTSFDTLVFGIRGLVSRQTCSHVRGYHADLVDIWLDYHLHPLISYQSRYTTHFILSLCTKRSKQSSITHFPLQPTLPTRSTFFVHRLSLSVHYIYTTHTSLARVAGFTSCSAFGPRMSATSRYRHCRQLLIVPSIQITFSGRTVSPIYSHKSYHSGIAISRQCCAIACLSLS